MAFVRFRVVEAFASEHMSQVPAKIDGAEGMTKRVFVMRACCGDDPESSDETGRMDDGSARGPALTPCVSLNSRPWSGARRGGGYSCVACVSC